MLNPKLVLLLTLCCLTSFTLEYTRNLAFAQTSTRLWPQATVYYEIASNFNPTDQTKIKTAMVEMSARTNGCLKFIKRTNQADYVKINNPAKGSREPCSSEKVGKKGGMQYVNLQSGTCTSKAGIMHELLHVIGFEHEHNHPDRDQFLTVNWGDILTGFNTQFKRIQTSVKKKNYDSNSVMHYDGSAFAKPGKSSMVLKNRKNLLRLAQKQGLTGVDIDSILTLYNCPPSKSNTMTKILQCLTLF